MKEKKKKKYNNNMKRRKERTHTKNYREIRTRRHN